MLTGHIRIWYARVRSHCGAHLDQLLRPPLSDAVAPDPQEDHKSAKVLLTRIDMTSQVRSALVLQGGGALGAYELGAARALYKERHFSPDLIAGALLHRCGIH